MKIYTEVNYEWKDGELVKTSSESFEYSGDIALCKGGGGNPFKKITDNVSGALKDNPVKIDVNPMDLPEVPIPNIPAPEGSLSDLAGGISLLTDNVASGLGAGIEGLLGHEKGAAYWINRVGDRIASAGEEALHGGGGYADDAGKPRDLGPTGDEEADATLLTEGRKREVQMGTAYHSGSGSAGQV